MPYVDDLTKAKNAISLLEKILNSVGVFIYGKDLEGRYIYANQAVLDLFGLPIEEVVGKGDEHFFDLPLSKQLKENDDIVLSQGVAVNNEEVNVVKSTGNTHVYRTHKQPILDEHNKVIGMCGVSTDITEEKKLQKLVTQQKKLLDTVLDNIDAHVYMKNCEREFLYVNSKTAALFGRPAEQIIGRNETEILPEQMAEHFHLSDKKLFDTNEKQVINEEAIDELGNTQHYLSVKIPYQMEGELPALIGFSSDVTELYQLKEMFRKQSITDPLTQLYNRRYFVERAEKEFSRAKRHGHDLSLISFDIDHFKGVNDLFGHPVGDAVLVELAKSVLGTLRNEDTLARIGGEEFSILLPETSKQVALTVAERIRLYQEQISYSGILPEGTSVTLSLGVASLSAKDDNFDLLFKRADEALYQAKQFGRNRVSEC